MREIPCHCDGANENCLYCGGRGYIREGIPVSGGGTGLYFVPATSGSSQKITQEMSALSSDSIGRPLHACPSCGALVRHLNRHMRVCKREPEVITKIRRLKSRSGHLNRGTPERNNLRPRSPLRTCPMCGVSVKSRNLARHLSMKCVENKRLKIKLMVSSRPGFSGSATTPGEIPQGVGTSDEKRKRAYDQVTGRDRIDATKDYAHKFRDHGQFGSHPSHDGFDDDSDPG